MDIPISKPYFTDEDKNAILEPLESGWVVQGPRVKQFESQFATFTGSKFAVATSNCTTALHLGLIALGIGRGDKVIVPSLTYIASANASESVGAIPMFCDIDLNTFNLDTHKLIEILEKEKGIKAIMPVHLFGLCADMIEIMRIADKYQLKVIEDSACGFDAWIDDKHSGTFGDCGCFSFHPRKAITTGEGGMLITNNQEIESMVHCLRDHGANKSDLERHKAQGISLLPEFNRLGYNYRMTDIQGALGITQMQKAKEIMQKRRKIAEFYDKSLGDMESILCPSTPKGYIHGFQSYVCIVGGVKALNITDMDIIHSLNMKRDQLMQKLKENGISTRQGTHAVHTLGYYRNKYSIKETDYIQSYKADRLSISLPLYPQMTDAEMAYIIQNIKENL